MYIQRFISFNAIHIYAVQCSAVGQSLSGFYFFLFYFPIFEDFF